MIDEQAVSIEYVRSLEERIMKLEERLARSEADDEIADLKGDGYVRGTPRGLIDAGDVDAKVCADSTCAECGHVGLRYDPWVRVNPKSYRAFSVCPSCGNREEF